MSTHPRTLLTPQEYLEIERKAEFRSEYRAGEMFAMAGAREAHNLINGNAAGELRNQLRRTPCRVYSNEMRVLVPAADLYVYPDVVVVCDQPRFADEEFDTLLNPLVLVEVLSASTEAYDRGKKFEYYATLPSVREYLLLTTEYMHADLFTREAGGKWVVSSASRAEDFIEFSSIPCRLSLRDAYEKVEFGTEPPGMHRQSP
ncbi:MAG TPA: Uma2 family endonuclease [Bryobacteraceae bacterium]